ncbi:MAG: ATP-dependent helicase [Bdellovibrionaceae bacterium]|nr:ATP-dependent helicase [Pseudobdellovibrionaceae bacterium]
MSHPFKWDDRQREIIEATSDFRIVVEAGPGTGKTEVACARVAHLLKSGIEPENILIFSFTRTAVAELRSRIKTLSGDEHRAAGVRITTLDSEVWQLCHGFLDESGVQDLFGSYEVNIRSVLEMLQKGSENLIDHLSRYRHVIIDEAQDLVSVRARFSFEFMRVLPKECGVTVFADSAQAIYGFTDEMNDQKDGVSGCLLDLIKGDQVFAAEFFLTSLEKVYRTGNQGLVRIFEGARPLLSSAIDPAERLRSLKEHIAENSDNLPQDLKDTDYEEMNARQTLMLFRRRAEVLQMSSILYHKKLIHRIRIGNLPLVIAPWIGALLGGYVGPAISKDRFDALWERRMGSRGPALGAPDRDEAWELLKRYGRGPRGDVLVPKSLRKVLSRSRPPQEFCLAEAGTGGMIVGTIHASKGREAAEVGLMMPRGRSGETDDEESRVLYVGATRAKATLKIGVGYSSPASALEGSGRIYRIFFEESPAAQVEIGLADDLDPVSVVRARDFRNPADIEVLQENLVKVAGRYAEVLARIPADGGDYDYRLQIRPDGENSWFFAGRFHQSLNMDLFQIGRRLRQEIRLKPWNEIKNLQFFGLRTVVFAEDSAHLEKMSGNYAASGMFVAPVIRGYTKVFFKEYFPGGKK